MGWGPHTRGRQNTRWLNWHQLKPCGFNHAIMIFQLCNYDCSRLTTSHCIVSSLSAMAALDVPRWNFNFELLIFITSSIQVVLDESGFSKGYGFVRCVYHQNFIIGQCDYFDWQRYDVKNICSGLEARRSSSTRLAAWLARWVLAASPSRSSPRNWTFIFATFRGIHNPLAESPSRPSLQNKTLAFIRFCQEKPWQCFSVQPNHHTNFPAGVHGQPKESRRKWLVIKLGFSILITNGKKMYLSQVVGCPLHQLLGEGYDLNMIFSILYFHWSF